MPNGKWIYALPDFHTLLSAAALCQSIGLDYTVSVSTIHILFPQICKLFAVLFSWNKEHCNRCAAFSHQVFLYQRRGVLAYFQHRHGEEVPFHAAVGICPYLWISNSGFGRYDCFYTVRHISVFDLNSLTDVLFPRGSPARFLQG